MDSKNIKNSEEVKEYFVNYLDSILNNKFHLFVVLGMILSYFYNLPVIKYSITGSNELRLYDVFGIFVLLLFFYNKGFIMQIIGSNIHFKFLYYFIFWCSVSSLLTLLFCIINNQFFTYLQILLYLYHFWAFYFTAIFAYIISFRRKQFMILIYSVLLFSSISSLVVLLQNLAIIPFLWSDVYLAGYHGFLSGVLGPNKIVLGITTLLVVILTIGLYLEKSIKVNRIIVLVSLLFNICGLLLSGSRTSYLGLLVFLICLFFLNAYSFYRIGLASVILLSIISILNPEINERIIDVVDKRVFNRITPQENIIDVEVGELYKDLGSGRDRLTAANFDYLLNNPQIIPLGMGFVNRFSTAAGLSAHNMYLQVIKELGLLGFFLYFRWLISYFVIKFDKLVNFSVVFKSLIMSMLVILFFGEHLYIYRPLFAILGLFLVVVSLFISVLHKSHSYE